MRKKVNGRVKPITHMVRLSQRAYNVLLEVLLSLGKHVALNPGMYPLLEGKVLTISDAILALRASAEGWIDE